MAAPVKVARQQTTPELSRTFRTLPLDCSELSGTFRTLPLDCSELSGTFRTLPPEPTPTLVELSRTLRNQPFGLPPEPIASIHRNPPKSCGTYTSTRWNSPEPSGTVRNLLRNLLLRPAPAHTGAYLG